METYIVRIYRRLKGGDDQLVGICEHVEKEKKISFKNVEQLVEEIMGPEISEEKPKIRGKP